MSVVMAVCPGAFSLADFHANNDDFLAAVAEMVVPL